MRLLAPALATLVLCALTAGTAAARPTPVTVVVAATVDDALRRAMPPEIWSKLVADWVNVTRVVPAPGAVLPSVEACRASGALYAVAARFVPGPRIMGASDPDRKRAVVHATVLNCLDATTAEKTIAVDSEPLSRASAGDYEPEVERTWVRPTRDALARSPFAFATLMRVTRVAGANVEIAAPSADLQEGQVLRVFADATLHPHRAADIVIIKVGARSAEGTWIPQTDVPPPANGDYVTVVVQPTATPAPRRGAATPSPAPRP